MAKMVASMRRPAKEKSWLDKLQQLRKNLRTYRRKFLNLDFIWKLTVDTNYIWVAAFVLFVTEVLVNITIIENVKYTEIDWTAYMQEVEGFLNGTMDYEKLKGDTGPLVYPAAFVYIFSLLYFVTSWGKNIVLAQYIFTAFYLILISLVFRIYHKSKKIPPYALIFLCCTSYRIHSIFVLRLFNDPVAMIFLYAAINMFIDKQWSLGSILYSLGVSVKMNVLLFSPALLVAYSMCLGFAGTVKQLFLCALVQVTLAVPFLSENPVGYVSRAFNLGRIFLFEWTVNWRFLPEEVFVDKRFHLLLLALHLLAILLFLTSWIRQLRSYKTLESMGMTVSCQLLLLPLFTANFIGLTFSRSLHYQFYVWYFHSLPYLLWSIPISSLWRLLILGVIELCWNCYPSTIWSSATLHLCHVFILGGLWMFKDPQGGELDEMAKKKGLTGKKKSKKAK